MSKLFANVISADKETEGNLGNNEYKSGYIEMKNVKIITRRDDVTYANNINLKKKAI